jgi:DNA-binding protein H-NS
MMCESCGHSSKDLKICPYCGTPLGDDNIETPSDHDSSEWGWADISIAAVQSADRINVIAAIKKEWQAIEHFTVLRLLDSQASALDFEHFSAKILVRRDLFTSLISKARQEAASVSATFTPVGRPIGTAQEANTIINLSKFPLVELKRLHQEVTRQIENRRSDELLKAREQILSIAGNLGVSVSEVLGNTRKKHNFRKTSTVDVKYQSHDNSKVS